MKLVKQKILYFSEGTSDKVYEVDLCESGSDLFVVNFRYGRRGANLQEGTKTVFPVTYDEAAKVFDALVASKEKKGYSENGSIPKLAKFENSKKSDVNTAREKTILKYLKAEISGTYTRDWKVSRIIWRAATLSISEATPLIAHFINSNDAFEQYAAIYALIKFKDEAHTESISKVFEINKFETKVGRIAADYLLKFGNASEQSKIKNALVALIPEDLKSNINDNHAILNAVGAHFLNDKDINPSLIYYLYLFSYKNDDLRKLLYGFVEKVPLKVNTFKSIRYIYRTSHNLDDVTFFALISKRIGISDSAYASTYLYIDKQWVTTDVEKTKANPSIAFSKKTKDYFNKNTYALVYDLSKNNPTDYVAYSVAVLTSLNDKIDNKSEEIQYTYNYDSVTRRYITEKTYYPKYHDFLALMYILYGNSTRLQSKNNKYFYTETLETSDLKREEALPEVWNTKPDEVLYILAHSKSEEAVQFSLSILKDNTKFLDDIPMTLLTKLVSHYHPRVLEMMLKVVENKYAFFQPESPILLALLESKNERAAQIGLNWLKQYEASYFADSKVVSRLLVTGESSVIDYLKEIYGSYEKYHVPLSLSHLEALFKIPSIFTLEYLTNVNDLIGNTHFGKLLSQVSVEEIAKLASSDATINKLFAANLAKHNSNEIFQLFKDAIDDYINSDEPVLRKVGVELLAQFPDDFLLKNHQMISSFCFSEYAEVRDAIQPTVERLMTLDEDFKNNLFSVLLKAISNAETYDGLHDHCHTLLTNNYKEQLNSISKEGVFELILSKYEVAQKLGLPLFKKSVELHSLPIKEITILTESDIFEIRDSIHHYFLNHVDRINYELEEALTVFNSNWDDVIDWSCDYFEQNIKSSNWTVDLLLYACDHTKTKVQAFGRRLITQHFTDDKGLQLLLKLQEHPTKSMQSFVTNYLDNYAKDNVDVILKLESFFKTSLFNINTNRTTKTRIYAFLEQESIKDRKVAEMSVRLINSVLGTETKIDQSHNIDLLLAISEAHPDVEVPLEIKSV